MDVVKPRDERLSRTVSCPCAVAGRFISTLALRDRFVNHPLDFFSGPFCGGKCEATDVDASLGSEVICDATTEAGNGGTGSVGIALVPALVPGRLLDENEYLDGL